MDNPVRVVRKARWVQQPYDAVRIDFEDGTMLLVSLEDVSPNAFPAQTQLTENEYEQLNALHTALAAWQGVLRRLSRTSIAKMALLNALVRDGFEREVAEIAVERAVSKGLLNDELLAKRWTEQRAKQQNKGRLRIKAELQQKGIRAQEAAEATKQIDPEEEYERALQWAQKKWPSIKGEFKQRQAKLGRQLQTRGFPLEMIRKIIRSFPSDS